MRRKLRCAVIGAGNMGKNHIRVYPQIAQLVAIADPAEKVGKPLAQEHNVPYYKDFRDMLDTEKPDAVSVVVPTRFHKEVALECLKRGIPTLVEKPIADSIENARAILNAAKKNNTLLMAGHIERFNPAIQKLKEIIDSGKLGHIISLNSIRVGINPPASANSDVVLDLAIHDIDVFNYLLGKTPLKVYILKNKLYEKNISDSAAILLSYPESKGIIQTNWVTPIKRRMLYITGTTGFVELDYISQKLTRYEKSELKTKNPSFSEFVGISHVPVKKIFVSKKEPLREELKYFLNAVSRGKAIDSSHALEALKVALTV